MQLQDGTHHVSTSCILRPLWLLPSTGNTRATVTSVRADLPALSNPLT